MKAVSVRELNSLTPEQFQQIISGPADEAARWLHAAAEHGIVEAQVHYAQRLLDGIGVPLDRQEAFQWFKLAAGQDHVMAMNMMGRCYENGWGVPVDMLLATYWFRLAAHAGLDWGMYNYATALALGRGVAVSRQEALIWLRKATEMGHVKSWNLLGGFYEDGWIGAVDMEAAFACYRKAADGGDFRGQFNCGRVLALCNLVEQAVAWIGRAYYNRDATAAFREKLLSFLTRSDQPELKEFGLSLQKSA